MAEKRKQPAAQAAATRLPQKQQHQQRMSFGLKVSIVFLALIALLGAGFAAGVYLNLVDLNKLAQTYKLYDYPLINQLLPRPKTNFETVALEPEKAPQDISDPGASAQPKPAAPTKPEDDKVEMEKKIRLRQQEEAKKLTKAARLYGSMKPEEAVLILNQLDDLTVLAILSRMEEEQVAKILASFDPKRAARLTQDMLKVNAASSLSNSN